MYLCVSCAVRSVQYAVFTFQPISPPPPNAQQVNNFQKIGNCQVAVDTGLKLPFKFSLVGIQGELLLLQL